MPDFLIRFPKPDFQKRLKHSHRKSYSGRVTAGLIWWAAVAEQRRPTSPPLPARQKNFRPVAIPYLHSTTALALLFNFPDWSRSILPPSLALLLSASAPISPVHPGSRTRFWPVISTVRSLSHVSRSRMAPILSM